MTPRALFTSIVATALAIAVAIGVASESVSSAATMAAQTAVKTAAVALPYAASAPDARLAAWNAPCETAV